MRYKTGIAQGTGTDLAVLKPINVADYRIDELCLMALAESALRHLMLALTYMSKPERVNA